MRVHRSYSLSSAPEHDAWPKVTVKRVDGGRVSNHFNDSLKVGDEIRVRAPEGRFVLREGERERPLVLFGGGSGITPLLSIAKTALLTTDRSIDLVYANRDRNSIIFGDELAVLARRFEGRMSVQHHLDAESGFMTAPVIAGALAGRQSADVYTCGPGPFMNLVEEALEAAGIAHEQRFFERFVSPLDPDRRPAEDAATAPAPGGAPKTFLVRLDTKKHEIPYVEGKSLLACAQQSGLQPPSSCEDGYCGCCMAKLVEGKVAMRAHEALTPQDIEKGWILPCQARPENSDTLEIDFDAHYG
jgi:3-ketosteroid 9alpha-monooxygenase subunit B